jgi:hypothetical protein
VDQKFNAVALEVAALIQNQENACISCLFATELLIELGDIIIPLSLVQVSSDRVAKVVLLGEVTDGKSSTVVSGAVGKTRLIKSQLSSLLVDQENVSVQTCRIYY